MDADEQDLKRMLGLRATRESRVIILLRQSTGEMYSREFAAQMDDISAATVAGVLRYMQVKGLLESRMVRSVSAFGNGLGRRYYRLPDRRQS